MVHSWEVATDLGAGFDPREVVFRGSNPSLEIPAGLLVPKASYLIKLSSARLGASQPHDASKYFDREYRLRSKYFDRVPVCLLAWTSSWTCCTRMHGCVSG